MTARDNVQRYRTYLLYAAALLALGTLGACTNGGAAGSPGMSSPAATSAASTSKAPSSTTATTAAPSPTTSTDPVIAKIPAAARSNTVRGAESFARYYVQRINEAFSRPDPAVFDGLYREQCDVCATYENTAADFVKKGQRQQQALLITTSATASKFSAGSGTVNVFFEQRSVPIVDKAGRTVSRTSSGKGALAFALTYRDGHWLVESLKASAA